MKIYALECEKWKKTRQGFGGLFVLIGGLLNSLFRGVFSSMSSDPLLQVINILLVMTAFVMGLLIWSGKEPFTLLKN